MEPTVIVAAVGVAGGIIGSVITQLFGRRREKVETQKTEADANEQIRATVMLLLEPLKTRITELECEIDVLKAENADLRAWSESLVRQVIELGGNPIPMRPASAEPPTGPCKRKGREE